ncbi:hypothetical protein T265_01197 [Opisthorchis viverrini]|uniref:Uncharacterized protein n=1 Tax=Opisthorchis viverrini TaxID=6198 RepID=A0A075AAD0_OPIVI|nr:hypothetical protein T265_01197 [Opisthorchis viverrini]KER32705.1 hypothetical protein T265_01197 [Opisthorchis viverrini]
MNNKQKGARYEWFKLSALPNLYADVLLGNDFLGLHGKVEIPFNGERTTLTVFDVTIAKLESPFLSANLAAHRKPIAPKSRRQIPEPE